MEASHHDRHDLQLSSPRRFVLTYKIVEESRVNIGLLVTFIASTLLVNGFFVVLILASKTLRGRSKHILILGVTFADILQGLLILPLITDIVRHGGKDIANCNTFQSNTLISCLDYTANDAVKHSDTRFLWDKVARFLADCLIPSITTLGVLALNIDYLLRLTCNIYAEGTSRASILITLFLAPWLISLLLLIPIYVVGVEKVSLTNAYSCHVVMQGGYSRALLVLSYILYGCLLLIVTLSVAMVYLSKRDYLGLDVTGECMQAPFDLCLASFIVILFYTPIFLYGLLTTEGYVGCDSEAECRKLGRYYTISLWFMLTKSWVLPLAWFFGRDTRRAIRDLFRSCLS